MNREIKWLNLVAWEIIHVQSNTVRSSITNPALGATFISFPDLATMAKKKAAGGVAVNKAAAKAAKKAKAAAKVERKEKKKVGKGRDEEDDGEDLEAILENVSR